MRSREVETRLWRYLQVKLNTDGVDKILRARVYFLNSYSVRVESVFGEGVRLLMEFRRKKQSLLKVGRHK